MQKHQLLIFVVLCVLLGNCSSRVHMTGHQHVQYDLSKGSPVDTSVYRFITPYRDSLGRIMNQPLAYTQAAMIRPVCGGPEADDQTALINFIADAWFKHAKARFEKEFSLSADFFISTCGGVRASLPKGEITLGNVYELMPFDNHFVLVKLDPDLMKSLLTFLTSTDHSPVAGIKILVEDSVRKVLINGVPYDPARSYYVIISNYHAGGGDNMGFLKDVKESYVTDLLFRDALIDEMKLLSKAGQSIRPDYEVRIQK